MTMIARRLQELLCRIEYACASAGRDPAGVRLLAVSKTFDAGAVAQAAAAGQRAFGENYIAEGVEKILALRAALPGLALQWHCIGPVQSNKTRPVAEHFDWLHSIERIKIAQRLSGQRPAQLPPLQVCIQVNVDGGRNKSGVTPQEAPELALAVAQLPRLRLRGLMSIPEQAPDFAAQKAAHMRAKRLFDQIAALGAPGLEDFDTLSLGMSADLDAAIAAGSTLLRVGSAIFGTRGPVDNAINP